MDRVSSVFDLHIGQKIRYLRIISGRSQTELGDRLQLTFQQIQKYERGRNKISAEKLWMIAEYFNVEIGYFFEGFEAEIVEDGTDAAGTIVEDASVENNRLRLDISRALQRIRSAKFLRGILILIRSFLDPDQPMIME